MRNALHTFRISPMPSDSASVSAQYGVKFLVGGQLPFQSKLRRLRRRFDLS
jgi:hypothetical protein